ncbi:MAG TPA: hypothetical protein VHP33_14805 [Polyangiaceae bacterium]|nr:hypothetical protein [Polyangiaceae bacterium]
MSRNTSISFLLLSGLGLLTACGEDKPAETGQPAAVQCPPGQIYDGRLCQTVGAAAAPTTAAPATAAPATTAAPAATGVPAIPGVATTQAGPTAAALDPTAAQAATQLIAPLGAQHAPAGAKPVGSAIAGNFQQGQSLEATIQLNANKCYTVVGVGLPPVTNLDVSISAVPLMPGLPAITLAVDNSTGSTAILGDKPNCYKAGPLSIPVKLTLTVSAGSGVAAAQVFEK